MGGGGGGESYGTMIRRWKWRNIRSLGGGGGGGGLLMLSPECFGKCILI